MFSNNLLTLPDHAFFTVAQRCFFFSFVLISLLLIIFIVRVYTSIQPRPIQLKGWDEHKETLNNIISCMKTARESGKCITIGYKTHAATTRSINTYKKNAYKINVSCLNGIIEFDMVRSTVWVESNVTFGEILQYLLPFGMIPKVTPEFKHITIGGAINGLGIESTSFKYGLFHETCLNYEVILGNGVVTYCNKNKNKDLFYGINGSFNSIALLTAAQLELIPINTLSSSLSSSSPCSIGVKLKYTKVVGVGNMVNKIEELCNDDDISEDGIESNMNDRINNININRNGNRSRQRLSTIEELKENECSKNGIDFIESMKIKYLNDTYIICSGKIVDLKQLNKNKNKNKNKLKKQFLWATEWWHKPYYLHVFELFLCKMNNENINCQEFSEYTYLYDYLFRHDRYGFWVMDRLFEKYLTFKMYPSSSTGNILSSIRYKMNRFIWTKIIIEFFVLRCFGWFFESKIMFEYRNYNFSRLSLNRSNIEKYKFKSEEWREYDFCVHDYIIPLNRCQEFIKIIESYFDNNTILWLCPVIQDLKNFKQTFGKNAKTFKQQYQRSRRRIRRRNNHDDDGDDNDDDDDDDKQLMINIGLYTSNRYNCGINNKWMDAVKMYQRFEITTYLFHGSMFYYSPSYLNLRHFWKYYGNNDDGRLTYQQYNKLKDKYKSNRLFVNLHDKIGTMGKKYDNNLRSIASFPDKPWTNQSTQNESDIVVRLEGNTDLLHFLQFVWSKHVCKR